MRRLVVGEVWLPLFKPLDLVQWEQDPYEQWVVLAERDSEHSYLLLEYWLDRPTSAPTPRRCRAHETELVLVRRNALSVKLASKSRQLKIT
jgi:hypothetical protein